MMAYCPNCGAQIGEGMLFCTSCGTRVGSAPAAPEELPAFAPGEATVAQAEIPEAGATETANEMPEPELPETMEVPAAEPAAAGDAPEPVSVAPEDEAPYTAPAPEPSAPAFQTVFCPSCGAQTSTEFAFCQTCGAPINAAPVQPPPAKEKKPFPKWAIFAGAGAVLVAVIVLLVVLLAGKGGKGNYALYIKDKEIFYSTLSGKDAWQVSSRLLKDAGNLDNEDLADAGEDIGDAITLSKDGKLLFFPDRISYSDDGLALYYRYVSNQKKEPVKIDSDIARYAVNDAATLVTYRKDSGTLYQYDLKKDEKEKIASDVENFFVSDDGKKIVYLTDEGTLYLKNAGKDREKLDSDVTNLCYVSKDLATVWYLKDGILYSRTEGKDKVKISSDVYNTLRVYEAGGAYYLKSDDTDISLMDYVEDDMRSADAQITEPEYPSSRNYNNRDDYNAAVDAYYAAYDRYMEKLRRDELREWLSDTTMSRSGYTLYYYDGKESVELTDAYSSFGASSGSRKSPVLAYFNYDQTEVSKVKLSEVESVYDLEDMVRDALYSSTELYVAVGGQTSVVEQEEARSVRVSTDGDAVYFIDNVPGDKNYGDLYRAPISRGSVQKPEVYDTDVYYYAMSFTTDGRLLYYKDVKNYKGELYMNKERVDYDVELYSTSYDEDSKTLLYYTDWNDDKENGTLMRYAGGKTAKIADDVADAIVTPAGDVLYLTDYSLSRYKGDLYRFNGKKSEKIDEDVVTLLPVSDSRYHGIS